MSAPFGIYGIYCCALWDVCCVLCTQLVYPVPYTIQYTSNTLARRFRKHFMNVSTAILFGLPCSGDRFFLLLVLVLLPVVSHVLCHSLTNKPGIPRVILDGETEKMLLKSNDWISLWLHRQRSFNLNGGMGKTPENVSI